MIPPSEKLALLRAEMVKYSIDAYLIPAGDPHLGEYIPDHWRIIPWLTGFTGSAATVIVTKKIACLWTDSRYFIQAVNQLEGSGFIFMKPLAGERNNYIEWLSENLRGKKTLGLDGRILSVKRFRQIESSLASSKVNINTECDLISDIWSDRPELPLSPAFDFPVTYSGRERAAKIEDMRRIMKDKGIDYQLLTSPDDIMWLLNIRGGDSGFSPVMSSFAIVGSDQVLLFVDETKIPFRLALEFDRLGIVILPYEEIDAVLSSLSARSSLLLSPSGTSCKVFSSVNPRMKIREGSSIPSGLKAVKNKTEAENICKAMIMDGVALSKLYFWIEGHHGTTSVSELSIKEKLEELRSGHDRYLGPSFSTIVAYNEHAALPHYSATDETNSFVGDSGLLLIDSGGQYLVGTTDITRTIAIGRPSPAQIKDFTLVLKGNINLAMAKIPAGTKGIQLDILARKHLWENGLNYGHGTGHGVGFCLNVHEAPPSVSPADTPDSKHAIEAGMLFSNEPAVYREGEYGIRIENLLLCYEDEETEFGQFLKFETVSLCYIDKSLIDKSLLRSEEIAWLNKYHSAVYDKISPFLSVEERNWLRDKTTPL
jgi:Xaa-Pro aminopeptidase